MAWLTIGRILQDRYGSFYSDKQVTDWLTNCLKVCAAELHVSLFDCTDASFYCGKCMPRQRISSLKTHTHPHLSFMAPQTPMANVCKGTLSLELKLGQDLGATMLKISQIVASKAPVFAIKVAFPFGGAVPKVGRDWHSPC
jgi:hypothetical protein